MVDVEGRIGEVGIDSVPLRHRVFEPPVVGLLGDVQHPTRHRDRHPHGSLLRGQLADERVHHFGEPPSLRLACHKYAAAHLSTSFPCSSRRLRRRNSRLSTTSAVLRPGWTPLSTACCLSQRYRHEVETPKSFPIYSTEVPGPRLFATLRTSALNSSGNAFDTATSSQQRPPPSQVSCHHFGQQSQ